jgi:hypothetical protein
MASLTQIHIVNWVRTNFELECSQQLSQQILMLSPAQLSMLLKDLQNDERKVSTPDHNCNFNWHGCHGFTQRTLGEK